MGWPKCNQTEELERIDEDKLWHGMEFHHFGLILSAVFGMISVLFSAYLIWRHATHFLKPWEQRHIIRVLFMVPIYSLVSFLSYLFYRHAVYFEVIRDCYEAFAIASFFSLLCNYIAPDLHSQKDYFRGIQPRNWILPINWFQRCCGGPYGIWRIPRSGLTWFNIIWFGVFQYCFIRVFMTLVALVTEAAGVYCLESLNPAFAHIWVMVIEGGCVTIAMYLLIQFYVQLKVDLAEHRPLLKISAIKLVIFLSFWQNLLISFLTSSGAIKSSRTLATPDIKVGIPSMLLCIEMAIFSVFHLWAFPWQVYDIKRSSIVASESAPGFLPDPKTAYQGGRLGIRALADAFNPWDFVKATGRAFRWIAVGRRHRMEDHSYQKSTTPGVGLEPTRNQFTAFNSYGGSNPYDEGGGGSGFMDSASGDGIDATMSSTAYAGAGQKSRRYQQLTHDGYDNDDDDTLLSSAQANPVSAAYPRPMERLPHPQPPPPPLAAPHSPRRGSGSGSGSSGRHTRTSSGARPAISAPIPSPSPPTAATNNGGGSGGGTTGTTTLPPPPYPLSPPPPSSSSTFPRSSPLTPNNNNNPQRLSYQQQQVQVQVLQKQHRQVSSSTSSQHSAAVASTLTPDAHPLGPAGGRKSSEQEEWDRHDGGGGNTRGESEVDLGGGHGVRDNRF